jgi:hypothetical protein
VRAERGEIFGVGLGVTADHGRAAGERDLHCQRSRSTGCAVGQEDVAVAHMQSVHDSAIGGESG